MDYNSIIDKINYCDEKNKKRRSFVRQEMADKCELLKKWALKLP